MRKEILLNTITYKTSKLNKKTSNNNTMEKYSACRLYFSEIDSQSHLLQFSELNKHIHMNQAIRYEHIYGFLYKQVAATIFISSLPKLQERLLEAGGGGSWPTWAS